MPFLKQERRKTTRRQADRELLAKRQQSEGRDSEERDRELRHRRRRAIRHHCKVSIGVKIGHSPGHLDTWTVDEHKLKGRILDLSGDGCQTFCAQLLEIGQELSIVITLESGAKIQATGVVRWTKAVSQREGFASGVQFSSIEAKAKKQIRGFLKELDETIGL